MSSSSSSSTPKVEYTLNILDICAIIVAILAILITIFIAYRTDHISSNTDQMIIIQNQSNQHLQVIRTMLEYQILGKVGG